jgi:hypothetical protein
MLRLLVSTIFLLVACSARPRLMPAPSQNAPAPYVCTEVIGLTITSEWYGAGFEELVGDSRFQARTRAHTFVDQWADPTHEAWSEPISSPCAARPDRPDRVVLFAANWKIEDQASWQRALEAFVATVTKRYPELRTVELFTVLRGPSNQSCGDPRSVVEPMLDAAISEVARAHPSLVQAGPRLEAADCNVFEKGGPHFTHDGRRQVAAQLAEALR